MATPSLIRLLVLLTIGAAVSQVAAWVDCGDASPSPPPSSSPSPSPLSTPADGSSSNAPFRANLLTLLGALPRAAAPTGFASLSLGAGRDRAFVRGLCRGDFQPPRCLADLQEAVRTIGGSCPSSRHAAAWLDVYVAYADTNATTPPRGRLPHGHLRHAPGSRTGRLLEGVRCADEAPGGVRGGRGWRRRRGRDDGEAVLLRNRGGAVRQRRPQRYHVRDGAVHEGHHGGGLRPLRRCLQASVPRLPCCEGNQGGVVLAYNCFLRIQVYTYYDLALDAPPSAAAQPPPVPSPSSPTPAGETSGTGRPRNSTIILAVVVPLGTLLLLAFVLTGVYLRRSRRRGVKERRHRPATATGRGRAKDDDRSTTYVHHEKFTLQVLTVATGNFAAENKLGEGGFGEVFKVLSVSLNQF